MRWISCALIIILLTLVPSAYGLMASLAGGGQAFALGTLLMLALVAILPAVWPRQVEPPAIGVTNALLAVPVAVAGTALLGWVSFRLLPAVFAGPLDPNRGDMLVIIEHAITQFLTRGNPYAIHHVPWDAPLSYGPVLWLPFVLPHVLGVDPRILTLVAQLVVPASLMLAAAARAGRRDLARAAALAGLGAALALNPDILRFHAIGHTQIYWPLLLIFAATFAGGRWTAAAICLGFLVAARTTMVALVPVFFLHLATIRVLAPRHALWFTLAAGLPFLPFLLADPGSVSYAMFGVYLKVMKGFVWYSTTWTQNTYGLTGRLLERRLERYVELAQVAALGVTYLLCWRSLHRGGRPEPWMALALLVFSMTTLWPVSYLYFDVWVLLACGLLSYDGLGGLPGRRVASLVACAAAACLAIVLSAAAFRPGSSYSLDIGEPSTAGYTGGGFGRDVAVEDEGRQVVWVEGETARVRVPRAGWLGATIRIEIRPNVLNAALNAGPNAELAHGGLVQRVSAALNGRTLGVATLSPGWQEITFTSRGRDWRYGFNVLDLQFTYAVPRRDGDGRALSAAIDHISID